jgi:hypothetical protein
METRISELLKLIREEISLYRDLIEHSRRKTALLVQGSVTALLESNKAEETFNIKLRMLEEEMRRLCLEFAQTLSVPREEFTLLKLAEGFEPPVAQEIRSLTNLFRNLVDQLKSVNQRNMRLVESSMRYSRGLLDFLANATSSYQMTGMFRPFPAVQTTISHRA